MVSTIKKTVAIEKVQRRATKLILALKELDYKERLRQLKLPTLKCKRYRDDLIQVFKIINGIDDLKFEDFFTTTKLDSTKNSEHKLYVHFAKTETRKFAFSNRVAPTWNSLLTCTKKAPSMNQFKSLLDKDPNLLVHFCLFVCLFFEYDE